MVRSSAQALYQYFWWYTEKSFWLNILILFLSAPVVFFCWDKVSCFPDWPQTQFALWWMTTDWSSWMYIALCWAYAVPEIEQFHACQASAPPLLFSATFSFLTTLRDSWHVLYCKPSIWDCRCRCISSMSPPATEKFDVSLSYMKSYL